MKINQSFNTSVAMGDFGQEEKRKFFQIPMDYINLFNRKDVASVLYYLETCSKSQDGWIRASDDEIKKGSLETRYIVRNSIKILKDTGIIDVCIKKYEGVPYNHYKINIDNIKLQLRNNKV